MKIYFATDHAGFELKEALVPFVRDELGHTVEDMGAHEYVESDDYPDYISQAARKVSEAEQDTDTCGTEEVRAVILGGSGQGEAIVANRFPHVRAAVYYGGDQEIVKIFREHNNANVISLGARMMDLNEAKGAIRKWLMTPFYGADRHKRRIEKIEQITQNE